MARTTHKRSPSRRRPHGRNEGRNEGQNEGQHRDGKKPARGRHGSPRSNGPTGSHSPGNGIWLYGRHAVTAALRNPARQCRRLLLTRDAEDVLGQAGVKPPIAAEIRTSGEIAAILPDGAAHQGFALFAEALPESVLEDVIAALKEVPEALVVVLDQVTDPRNVGAILRSAAAFGAAAVILPERHGTETTGALAKTASGALETVPLVRVTNVARTLETLKTAGFWCVALAADALASLADTDLSGRTALVLGSEGAGLRRLVAETCDTRARLPIGNSDETGIDSLNVATAAAIALYEAARRRT